MVMAGAAYAMLSKPKWRSNTAAIGDEIRVAEGTYKPVRGTGKTPGDVTASFNLVSGVEMYGGFLGRDLKTYIQKK